MNNDWITDSYLTIGSLAVISLVYILAKEKLTKSRFFRFLGILAIGSACALFPLWWVSLIIGFPSVLLASILVSCFLDKENKGE